MRDLHKHSQRLLYLVGRMINLCHLLHDPPAQHSQSRGPMAINSRAAVHVQGLEHHHRRCSSIARCGVELHETGSRIDHALLFDTNAVAQRQIDSRAATFLFVGPVERPPGTVHALARPGNFKLQNFDHFPDTSGDLVPSTNQQGRVGFVPAADGRSLAPNEGRS